jgi:small subunit ribosomal protein S21
MAMPGPNAVPNCRGFAQNNDPWRPMGQEAGPPQCIGSCVWKVLTSNLSIACARNNVDQPLRFLKKKLQHEELFRQTRLREHCEKCSENPAGEKASGGRARVALKKNRAVSTSAPKKGKAATPQMAG